MWLGYFRKPLCATAKDNLACTLDWALKVIVPDGRNNDILSGRDSDIRQEAYMLLIKSYLKGNRDLKAASKLGSRAAIGEAIEQAIHSSINFAKYKLIRSIKRELRLHVYCGGYDEIISREDGSCPKNHKGLWACPPELRSEFVFKALHNALAQKLLPEKSIHIALIMLEQELTQSQIAKSQGVSRTAIHARLMPVREYLKKEMEKQEFPLY